MKRTESEMMREIKDRMRGGEGQVEIVHLFAQEELKGRCRLVARLTLMPGCSIGPHVHEAEEEIFYIMSGTAAADDNGTAVRLEPGDTLKTGGGESHAIANAGDVPLVLFAVILLF